MFIEMFIWTVSRGEGGGGGGLGVCNPLHIPKMPCFFQIIPGGRPPDLQLQDGRPVPPPPLCLKLDTALFMDACIIALFGNNVKWVKF